jgi:hypothetical protein
VQASLATELHLSARADVDLQLSKNAELSARFQRLEAAHRTLQTTQSATHHQLHTTRALLTRLAAECERVDALHRNTTQHLERQSQRIGFLTQRVQWLKGKRIFSFVALICSVFCCLLRSFMT